MKNRFFICFIIFVFFLSASGICEAANTTVPDGTLVKLRLENSLSSKVSKKGDMVKFSVVKAVKIGSNVAIDKGAFAQAQITDVRGPGKFGKNARIKMKFLFVVDKKGKHIPVKLGEESAKINKQEGYAIGASAGGFLLLGPIGLVGGIFVKGKDVEIPEGTELFVEVGS